MARSITIHREVPDLYNPDPEALIEVAIDVEFEVTPAEPDVGIMGPGVEDVCVVSTSSAMYPVEWAQAWLDRGTSTNREFCAVMDKIEDAATEGDGPDPDDWYDRMRDERDA